MLVSHIVCNNFNSERRTTIKNNNRNFEEGETWFYSSS